MKVSVVALDALAVGFADNVMPEAVTDQIVVPVGMPAPDTAIPTTSPAVDEIVMALLFVAVDNDVMVLLEIAAAAALGTPVTPAGSEVVGLFSPKPKSEPTATLESYQTDKFLPSVVVKVNPPTPESPATTPCDAVLALIEFITY